MIPVLHGVWAAAGGLVSDYEHIETVTVTGTSTTEITLGSGGTIPQTYKHLQIRAIAQRYYTPGVADGYWFLRLNGNSTAGDYVYHALRGNGTTADSYSYTSSQTAMGALISEMAASFSGSMYGAGIVDLLDYTSTSKYKTMRKLSGFDRNGAGAVGLVSGLWLKTNAVTSITIWAAGDTFNANTSFSLYGVK